MKLSALRPTPAVVVATGALVVALGGTSYAAAKISGTDIKKHSIPGNRMINNTLTGKQINESRLGTVPRAKHATTAGSATTATRATSAGTANSALTVDGQTVGTFILSSAKTDASPATLTLEGITLSASCPTGEALLTADSTAASGETLVWSSIDSNSAESHSDGSFTTDSADHITPTSDTNGTATVVVTSSSKVLTLTLAYQSDGTTCVFSGSGVATF